ncbi:hypothetical protein FRC0485_02326 [Corynebacterium diphtheriae]|nr:hypothetical protein CIP103987_02041 [Corynebacterium diphtheriae]CAB0570992.1 hypothetical protein CIP107526_02095 [Corynebacterium diphtheriae]CAB0574655.1 hypothetical protein CIP107524_02339 [Corynebacterium diphtheriae]CAB0579321.1 hypothetical protein CIP107537_00020 [Corynebacterium diphtheriae]CAB0819743.1 hypothetical protein FRC0191_02243 [Corynebacterium diphtheriae]
MSDVGGVDQAPQDVVVEVVEAEGDALQEPDPCKDPNHLELTQSNFQGPVQTAAVGWLDHRRRTVGDRYRGAKGLYSEHDRYGESTPAASLAALKAERADVFNDTTGDYDLDPAADIYAE